VYGGQDRDEQLQGIRLSEKQVTVLVATPGRLLDFLRSDKVLSLDQVACLVVDEADRMLALGFIDQVTDIADRIRPDRQVLLFTATFPGRLRATANILLPKSVIIRCSSVELGAEQEPRDEKINNDNIGEEIDEENDVIHDDSKLIAAMEDRESKPKKQKIESFASTEKYTDVAVSVDDKINSKSDKFQTSSLTISKTVTQNIHVCASHKKPRLLIKYITSAREKEKEEVLRQPGAMIIFCNKIKTLKFLKDFLTRQGITVELLHGQLQQTHRETTLNNFKAVRFIYGFFLFLFLLK
jgi:superfamily II DNA/RNA helicase